MMRWVKLDTMDCSTDTNARPDPRTEAVRPSGLGTAVESLQVS